MNTFDRIFVINLDHRTDRWSRAEQMLNKLRITNYERFSAIAPNLSEVAWKNSYRDVSVKHARKHKCPLDKYICGALGCKMSHYHVILLSKERNYKNVLILEDDAVIANDFAETLKNSLSNLPENWHMLYLGGTVPTPGVAIGIDDPKCKAFPVVKVAHGIVKQVIKATHAYAVNSTFFDTLLSGIANTPILEIDRYYANELQLKNQGNIFSVDPLVVHQDRMSLSDITMDVKTKFKLSNVIAYCNTHFFHNKMNCKYANLTDNGNLHFFEDVLKWECVPLAAGHKIEFLYIEGPVKMPNIETFPDILLIKNIRKSQASLLKQLFETKTLLSDVTILTKRSHKVN